MVRRTCGALALAALAAGTLTGCSGDVPGDAAAPSAATTAAAPTFTALVWRSREDEAAGRRLQVKVTNTSAEPVTVTSVRLRDHGFAPVPAAAQDTAFAPGERFDLRIPNGAAACPAEPVTAPRAEIGWRTPDGRTGTATVAADVENDVLTRARRDECAEDDVARTAVVSLVVDAESARAQRPGSGPGARVPAALRLRRPAGSAGGEPVRVVDLTGSVVYEVVAAPGTAWPQTLPAGRDVVDVPLRVGASTCSGHSLGETKKPFVFLAYVEVGAAAATGKPVTVTVGVDAATREVLLRLVRTVCAGG